MRLARHKVQMRCRTTKIPAPATPITIQQINSCHMAKRGRLESRAARE
jgi:hypothetical protein